MRLMALLAAAVTAIALPGVAAASIVVRDPVIRPAAKGGVTAAYMTLVNTGPHPLTLTGADCGCAEMVMAHRSTMQNGMAHMAAASDVVAPPHGQIVFAPGGLHLMVMGLKRPIKPGERIPLQLRFGAMAPLTVQFSARR